MFAMMYWGNGSGWGYVLMAAWMVLFWGLVIGAIVLAVRAIGRSSAVTPPQRDAQQILAGRFARGEIDETEYQQRLSALRGSPTPSR
jgi:putative membrane protein